MENVRRHHNKGLTLIEIMISMLAILIIAIGVMGYMYASAGQAREADIQAAAGRIGLLLIECWKANGIDVSTFNPVIDLKKLSLSDFGDPGNLGALPGLANILKTTDNPNGYRIIANNIKYFIRLTYDNNTPKTLCVVVAWNQNNSLTSLGSKYDKIVLTDYSYIN